jgi:hypothetical protein
LDGNIYGDVDQHGNTGEYLHGNLYAYEYVHADGDLNIDLDLDVD